MARNFAPVEPQQLFEQAKPYQPTANQLQAVEDTFVKTISDRVDSDYTKLADQYENKQISDQDFATGVELLAGRIQQPTLKEKWVPIVGQAKYLVFSNAQGLTDSKIQEDLNNGVISPGLAIQRYNEMASAALQFNTQTSLKDAAAWSLKASTIQAALRSSRGGGGGGSGSRQPKNLDDIKRQYESAKFSLDQDQQMLNANLQQLDAAVSQGLITTEEANGLRQDTLNEYYNSVSSFGYSDDVLDYISEVDPIGGYGYLNSQIDYTHGLGLPIPGYFSGYQSGLNEYQASLPPEEPQPTYEITDVLNNLVDQSSFGPRRAESEATPAPQPPLPPVPLVAQETQRQSNPLGLGTGGPPSL